jgi:hypothetical protein
MQAVISLEQATGECESVLTPERLARVANPASYPMRSDTNAEVDG